VLVVTNLVSAIFKGLYIPPLVMICSGSPPFNYIMKSPFGRDRSGAKNGRSQDWHHDECSLVAEQDVRY